MINLDSTSPGLFMVWPKTICVVGKEDIPNIVSTAAH